MTKHNNPKSEMLRKQGCLNQRAEKVKSKLFQKGDFFDPQDLIQVKYEMLRQVLIEKQPILQAARQFGFSRPSFYQTLANFKQNGLLGLIRTKPGPRNAHKLSDPVIKFLEKQRAQDGSITLNMLAKQIKETFGIVVHIRSIQRALAQKKKKLP
ncbi:MAG: helix-turn-helix domain containing protein [Desulfobulbaceae bacterium]|jgi:transposase|nr:helix-turn-helix domain containing protein [Desulfobulbaceae bacterium]